MRIHEIENWALGVVDRVTKRQPVEDSRIEVKAEWPKDVRKAARRIAGHANAAGGEPVLWLVGVDEKKGSVPGVDFAESATWYSGVRACFDELAPEPLSINMPIGEKTVAVFYFETDRAPYVIKNAEGGAVQREVPWREATGIRSATRSQLLRILSPLQLLPDVEVVGAFLIAGNQHASDGVNYMQWEAAMALFMTQPAQQQTVIPSHRCDIAFVIEDCLSTGPLSGIEFRGSKSKNVEVGRAVITITGPALFEARCKTPTVWDPATDPTVFDRHAAIRLSMRPASLSGVVEVSQEMRPVLGRAAKQGFWQYGPYEFYA